MVQVLCVSSPHANVGVAYKKLFFNNLFNCLHVCLFDFSLFISHHNSNNFYITASEDDTHKDVTKYQDKNKINNNQHLFYSIDLLHPPHRSSRKNNLSQTSHQRC